MLVLFIFTSFLCCYIDYRIWHKLTPLMISYIGVFIIVVTHYFIGERLGFVSIDENVFLYLSIFITVGLIASLACYCATLFFVTYDLNHHSTNKFYDSSTRISVITFSLLIALLCLYYIINSWYKLGTLVSEDFEGLLTYGLAGHSFAILVSLLPFLLKAFFSKKNKYILSLIIFIFLLLFMKQVKYWVMIPLVWMIWYSIYSGFLKIDFLKSFFISIVCALMLFLLFFLVYFMKVVLNAQNQTIDYSILTYDILIHFFGYLYSGVLTFSAYIEQGVFSSLYPKDILGLFSGPLNVINILVNNDLMTLDIVRPFVTLNTTSNSVGNVPTLWGTLLISAGYVSFIVYFFVMFFIYFLQWCARFSTLAAINYTFLTSFLFFSWFDYYYYLLMPFEVCVFCCIFYCLFDGREIYKRYVSYTLEENNANKR
ncbi:DUF6337 family protein [Pantoea sp. GM01]|uniref:DUF6337 family protein n=1 Tax=Pantoea sp. GM01 TaxID=1144320 RepID=UPI000271435B|nr:DUF6337 family protein [Pantoea sp. GM01]EJL89599.1 hypothetical protein PMI17_02083 [Pantoea sp. GM01]